jgi:hypothetical protein
MDPGPEICDPVTSAVMGLPADLLFRTKASWPPAFSPGRSPMACDWTS